MRAIQRRLFNPTALMLVSVCLAVAGSCSSDEPDITPSTPSTIDCSTAAGTFTQANAIIQGSCANSSSCHASGSHNGPGTLTTYTQIFNARTSIKSAVRSGVMPQNGRLSDAEKAAIICWIDAGAPDN
jgi:hypothetical protein